jgi:hypothetical protein
MSCYFDITEDTEINIRKSEQILNYKGYYFQLTATLEAKHGTTQ